MTNNQILLREIISQEFDKQQFCTLSAFFEFFSASLVLKDYDFSSEEIENGLIGGVNDGGCDAGYVILNNEIITPDQVDTLDCAKGSTLEFVIIQSKNETGFGEDAIMKWKTISENLFDMSNDVTQFKDRYCEGVRDVFMLFRDVITKLITKQLKIYIKYYYVTVAVDLHQNTIAQADELKKIVAKNYPSANISVNFIGANELMTMFNTEKDININVKLADQPISLGKENEYVTLINLSEYYNFITDTEGNLLKGIFESNVRDYQGKNSVNSCIADTLHNKNLEDFWWLNNGITILSDKIIPITNRQLSILNPAIVNGLQTSTEIFNFFSANKDRLNNEERCVLVRFIVPPSEEVRDDIIFATNNQTNIPKSSLRVTDPIHLQIEMYCKSRGLYYDRRKNYYKNQKKKANDIISVSFLAQCLITLLLRKPDFARARPSTLLTDDKIYDTLYSDRNNLSTYYVVGKLGKLIQDNIRKTPDWTSSEKNDMLFYVLYSVAVTLLQKTTIKSSDIIEFDISRVQDELINSIKYKIYEKYKELGGNGSVAKNSQFIEVVDKLMGFTRNMND
ncbi:MAG: AIPR family protein [Muribaculaceae bacterium]|nr:AIPR family protein [Muribaculaceae bacterium]